MNCRLKLEDVRRINLDDAAEARLLERVLTCGGYVVQPDIPALEQQMAQVVALLVEIDNAILPPIIRDRLVS